MKKRMASSENMFRIKFNPELLQKPYELLLKRHLAMMPFLVRNISLNRAQIGFAYAECSIAFLPGEFHSVLVHPAGGIRLDERNNLGRGDTRRHLNQQVNVVLHAAIGKDQKSMIASDAGHIRP